MRIKAALAEANHRQSQLQAFRSSVARLLHLRDLPEADLLHRLQTLCHAHQEFTLLSHKYEAASPVPTPCPRYTSDHLHNVSGLPSVSGGARNSAGGGGGHERRSTSPGGGNFKRFEDEFHEEHFDDEFDFSKKY